MIVSLNWLKKFTPIDISVDELVNLIGSRLVEVESVIKLGDKYKDVLVAKVVFCQKIDGSDHLNLTKIDDGGVNKAVERDSDGLIQVVCGANNVSSDMLVAWLPPGSVVPNTYGTAEPFTLSEKELLGYKSNGMLASAKELDLYDEHSGILSIDENAEPGELLSKVYELDDYLLDIENKSLTHRPDTFGIVGFAREVAGIQGKEFNTPDWLFRNDFDGKSESDFEQLPHPKVKIFDPELSNRFGVVVLGSVKEKTKSSVMMQTYLARSGVRPISASVDISNYLMLLSGQPSHAYDYDKLKHVAGDDFTIGVRRAKKGEELVLIDGKKISLDERDTLITAGDTPIGLAGIMGGESTKVDSNTKAVIFEAATFNLYDMRASQMRHGIFSEAITRFTKGVPAYLGAPVTVEAVRLLSEKLGAKQSSDIIEDFPGKTESVVVNISEQQINNALGTQLVAGDIASLLTNVGFKVAIDNLNFKITVPYWRADIHLPEDIIEEVGRLYGFDNINLTLPKRQFSAVKPSRFDIMRTKVRELLVRAGANEVSTYSFVHEDLLRKAEQDLEDSYKIVNSISPELQYYRQSLSPSLLVNIHPNIKAGFDNFAIFELNKVHSKKDGVDKENVPVEKNNLALIVASKQYSQDMYYQAKATLEWLVLSLGLKVTYGPLDTTSPTNAVYEPKRSAYVKDIASGRMLGVVGEYKERVQKSFKLPKYCAGFELNIDELFLAYKDVKPTYAPISRYPVSDRDICFKVKSLVSYAEIIDSASKALKGQEVIFNIIPVDIYQAKDKTDSKNITIRITVGSYGKTLTSNEASQIIESVINEVVKATGGEVI